MKEHSTIVIALSKLELHHRLFNDTKSILRYKVFHSGTLVAKPSVVMEVCTFNVGLLPNSFLTDKGYTHISQRFTTVCENKVMKKCNYTSLLFTHVKQSDLLH